LNALQNLHLQGCWNLQEFLTSSGQLNTLQIHSLWGYCRLQE
jgi:hypothetical protein